MDNVTVLVFLQFFKGVLRRIMCFRFIFDNVLIALGEVIHEKKTRVERSRTDVKTK